MKRGYLKKFSPFYLESESDGVAHLFCSQNSNKRIWLSSNQCYFIYFREKNFQLYFYSVKSEYFQF